MKNSRLKSMLAARMSDLQSSAADTRILNASELDLLTGGEKPVQCPNLQSCGTFSNCNGKCTVDGIKVPIPIGGL
jgi:hypothetical protein